MYEIEIHKTTEDAILNFIYGYSVADAFRRHPELNRSEWTVVSKEYVD